MVKSSKVYLSGYGVTKSIYEEIQEITAKRIHKGFSSTEKLATSLSRESADY